MTTFSNFDPKKLETRQFLYHVCVITQSHLLGLIATVVFLVQFCVIPFPFSPYGLIALVGLRVSFDCDYSSG